MLAACSAVEQCTTTTTLRRQGAQREEVRTNTDAKLNASAKLNAEEHWLLDDEMPRYS